jgi:multiple sugar transport system substrate-binding protein
MRARSRNSILAAAAAAVLITAGMPAGAQDKVQIDFWQRQFEDYQQAWFKEQVDAFNA